MPSGWLWFETLKWQFFTADLREGVLVPLWRIAASLRLRYAADASALRACALHAVGRRAADRHACPARTRCRI